MIVCGTGSQVLGTALAQSLSVPVATVTRERFPDGEFLLRVPDFEGQRAIVVVSTVSSDAHLEVLQLQDAVREAGATEVVTVIPYLGYGRQDAAFEAGEPVSVRAVARAISTGTDRVITVNPHEPASCEYFDPPAEVIDAGRRLGESLPDDLVDPVFLAPDEGARDLAATVQQAYGNGVVDHFEKTRHSGDSVTIAPSDVDVAGRDVVIVDDIIATGSTMATAIDHLEGARRRYVTCVHPVLADGAYSRLRRAGVTDVLGTDTIEHPVSAVSVAPAIANYLEGTND